MKIIKNCRCPFVFGYLLNKFGSLGGSAPPSPKKCIVLKFTKFLPNFPQTFDIGCKIAKFPVKFKKL